MTNHASVTVYQLRHNGACWEHIEGASWPLVVQAGTKLADALLHDGPGGDWPDGDDTRVAFVARDDEGEYVLDDDGDERYVFTAGELRRGRRDD
jgi:hypothetical protein